MRELRRLWLHGLLFVLAAVLAFMKARPEAAGARVKGPTDVELWAGKPSAVRRVELETKKKRVTLESQVDAAGQWYRGSEKALEAAATPDAGAPDAGAAPRPEVVFVSVGVAQKLSEKLAPLVARHEIRDLDEERLAVFGFDKPFGTLRVQVSETSYELDVGGTTPGGGDRYVRNTADGRVYTIDGSVVRDLDAGASRLKQQDLNELKLSDPTLDGVRVKADGQTREIVRGGPEGRRFWAAKDKPDDKDEKIGNWLDKLDKLRPLAFVEDKGEAELVVRVEYLRRGEVAGFTELYRRGDEYLVTSALLRLPGTLAKASAEQVAQDVASLMQ
ncbi:MAG: DUF4340 domain-containing protein [Polyangiaceae bacterium]|nr:DUF4340 domain-containing protein [Polyangiaceae bacterium]